MNDEDQVAVRLSNSIGCETIIVGDCLTELAVSGHIFLTKELHNRQAH